MKILIIDDSEFDALELSTRLTSICAIADITWISCPENAFVQDLDEFDFCFIDQHMPGVLGTDLVTRMRAKLGKTSLRIIMQSGDGADKTRAQALVSDCDGFLTKPVATQRLRTFLSGSQCRWELSELPSDIEQYWRLQDSHQTPAKTLPVGTATGAAYSGL